MTPSFLIICIHSDTSSVFIYLEQVSQVVVLGHMMNAVLIAVSIVFCNRSVLNFSSDLISLSKKFYPSGRILLCVFLHLSFYIIMQTAFYLLTILEKNTISPKIQKLFLYYLSLLIHLKKVEIIKKYLPALQQYIPTI